MSTNEFAPIETQTESGKLEQPLSPQPKRKELSFELEDSSSKRVKQAESSDDLDPSLQKFFDQLDIIYRYLTDRPNITLQEPKNTAAISECYPVILPLKASMPGTTVLAEMIELCTDFRNSHWWVSVNIRRQNESCISCDLLFHEIIAPGFKDLFHNTPRTSPAFYWATTEALVSSTINLADNSLPKDIDNVSRPVRKYPLRMIPSSDFLTATCSNEEEEVPTKHIDKNYHHYQD